MRFLKLVPGQTRVNFAGQRYIAFAVTGLLFLVTTFSLVFQGLNLGLDFTGGIVVEVAASQPPDLADMRARLNNLGLGEVKLQDFGESGREVQIRVQPSVTGTDQQAVAAVREALGPGYQYRRVDVVGPTVSGELFEKGLIATILAIVGIGLYVTFRFEWQFGLSAILATFHDVYITLGLFSILQLDFNMTAVAALLTLAGYSINDTVVVFDRMRENARKYKQISLHDLINRSVNDTLARTVMTGMTVMIAVVPLLLVGGPTLLNFSASMLFGVVIGTFSSIYVAAALLFFM
ncbi:MAG: protein translocase subunit SecF, partial [Planctomycetes bacterium]|nr:protein translocase subunit SecF [Planctomycetota bacterium]